MTRNLLLTGGPTHPFAETAPLLVDLFADAGIDTVVVTEPVDAVAALRAAEAGAGDGFDLVTVHALRWRIDQARYADQRAAFAVDLAPDDLAVLDRFVRSGGGLLALHTAVICFDGDPTWRALCGAAWRWDVSTHPPLGPVDVTVTAAGEAHAITGGLGPFQVHDEVYAFLDEEDGLEPLLVGAYDGHAHPLLWARTVGAGRVVTDLLGHGPASLTEPTHRTVLARAAAWALGRPASEPRPPTAATGRQP